MRNNSIAPSVNPYNHQLHLFSKNQPENLEFLRKFRAVLAPYHAAAVGEVGDAQRGLEIMAEYTSGGDKVQMCYPFEMLQPSRLTAGLLEDTFARMAKAAPDAWPCWAYSNHDTVRHTTRWNLSDDAAKTYAALLICLRGSICLYQGEELGLPEADIAFADLQDPYGIQFWPEFKGRDGCRTPMIWDTDNSSGGFSTGKPWLPVTSSHLGLSVAAQSADPTSMLAHYRAALALRRAHATLRTGGMTAPTAAGDLALFERHGAETIFCAFNLGDTTAKFDLPAGDWQAIGTEIGGQTTSADRQMALGPWQFCLALKN